jgi:adenylate cyclase
LLEIERKFLVEGSVWKSAIKSKAELVQGYLFHAEQGVLRVRIADTEAFLTIKLRTAEVTTSEEYEYRIPLKDAQNLLDKCTTQIAKTRYTLQHKPGLWTVDVFKGANAPLILAEVEILPYESWPEVFPTWMKQEVTEDKRYRNSHLVENPYSLW